MKKITLLSFLFMASATSFAQLKLHRNLSLPQQKHQAFVQNLMEQTQVKSTVHKTNGTLQRVIAQVNPIEFDGDSTIFRYSGNRGSTFNFNTSELGYQTQFEGFVNGSNILHREFPALADSIRSYSSFILSSDHYAFYRSDNQIDSSYSQFGNATQIQKFINVYDAQGHLTMIYNLNENSLGDFDTLGIQRFYYNPTFSQLLSDSIYQNTPLGAGVLYATEYNYESTGELASLKTYNRSSPIQAFSEGEKVTISYYSTGQVHTVSSFYFPSPGIEVLTFKDSLIYQSGIDYYTEWHQENWDGSSFVGSFLLKQFPGSNGVPDSLNAFFRDDVHLPWQKEASLKFNYNTFNNPTSMDISYEDEPGEYQIRFYYEEYSDGVTIQNLKATEFAVFPNPFLEQLTIEFSPEVKTQNFDVQFTNILGQTIFKENRNFTAGISHLKLPQMTPGLYFLVLTDQSGNSTSKRIVKK